MMMALCVRVCVLGAPLFVPRGVLAHAIGSIVSRARVSALLDIFAAPLFVTRGALAHAIGGILSRVRVAAFLDTRELNRTTLKTHRRPSKIRRGSK